MSETNPLSSGIQPFATGSPYPPAPYIVVNFDGDKDAVGIFHLFSGDAYDAGGGMADYIGIFKTLGEAFVAFAQDKRDWGQIATIMDNGSLKLYLEYGEEWDNKKHGWVVGWRRVGEDGE